MCTQEEISTSLKIPVKLKKSQSCQNCQPLSENKIQDKFIERKGENFLIKISQE